MLTLHPTHDLGTLMCQVIDQLIAEMESDFPFPVREEEDTPDLYEMACRQLA